MGEIQQRKEATVTGPRLALSLDVAAVIREHVEAAYPEEACGGLLGSPNDEGSFQVMAAVPIENSRSGQRERRYLIGPEDVLQLEKDAEAAGLEVIGYYHSHPNAPPLPSEFDREHAWPWYAYLIISVHAGKSVDAQAWRLAEDREAFDPVHIDPTVSLTTEIGRQ
jgi:proteasome lid subunit RPN8/RPN11